MASLGGIYVAAALILLASVLVGRALYALMGRHEASWLAPAVGFAVLTIAERIAVRLPGHATTAALAFVALALAAALYLALSRRPLAIDGSGGAWVPLAVALIVLAAMTFPFLASDRVGVLGVGRQSDFQEHIYVADYLLNATAGIRPAEITNGYPLGPHAIAAGLAKLTGASTESTFTGLILALPVLLGWTALAALRELPGGRRTVAAVLVGLPYLLVCFLTEGTFKEPAEALFVVAFALALAEADKVPRRETGLALIALAGGAFYVYSYPGLVWLVGTAAIWAAIELVRGNIRLSELPRPSRRAALLGGVALLALAAIAAPEARHAIEFRHNAAFVQDTAERLRGSVSPATALGVWPSGNFRVDPASSALATILALAALLALAYGVLWWVARRQFAVLAALFTAALVYIESRFRSGLYIEAKALVVAAPLVMLVSLRALLTPPGRAKLLAGALICAAAASCTFVALRDAQVAPSEHAGELAKLRKLMTGGPHLSVSASALQKHGKRVLLLTGDRLAQHELRGMPTFQGFIVVKAYPNPNKHWAENRALDWDSIATRRLNRFDYVITTRAAFASQAPPNYKPFGSTANFILWKRGGDSVRREPPPGEGDSIGVQQHGCGRLASTLGPNAHVIEPPVLKTESKRVQTYAKGDTTIRRSRWDGGPFFGAGHTVSQTLDLPAGRWNLSLQYDSPVTLTVTGPGLRATLPPSFDGENPYFEGTGQFWPAGQVRGGGPVRITVSARKLNGIQRLLGVERRAALGILAATSTKPEQTVPIGESCGDFVDWYGPSG